MILPAGNILFDHIDMHTGLSNPTINSIYQDENDMIWIATRDGLNRYTQGRIEVFRPEIGDTTGLFGNNIQSVCGDGNGKLYLQCLWGLVEYDQRLQRFRRIATQDIVSVSYGDNRLWICSSHTLYTYDTQQQRLEKYNEFDLRERLTCVQESQGMLYVGTRDGVFRMSGQQVTDRILPGTEVMCLYADAAGDVWVGTLAHGLYRIETSGRVIHYRHEPDNLRSLSNNYIRAICEDNRRDVWIGTAAGLNRLHRSTGEFSRYTHAETDPNSLSNSSVWSLMKDRQGTLWIGTFYGGIDRFNPDYAFASYYRAEEGGLSFPVVNQAVEQDNRLWIATDGGGLNCFDRRTQTFTHYRKGEALHTLPSDIIKDIWPEPDGTGLWLGTHLGGLCRFDTSTGRVKRYSLPEVRGIGSNDIRSVEQYEGRFYLGTKNLVWVFDPATGESRPLIGEFLSESRQVWNMRIDSRHQLWFSTSFAIFRYDLRRDELHRYTYDRSQLGEIGENYQNCFFEDSRGQMWLGSAGSGLFRYLPESDSFLPVNTRNSGILGDYIIHLTESASGHLLVATNLGFSRHDTREMTFRNYAIRDISPLSAINERGLSVTSQGEIVIGGFNGMVILHEHELDFARPEFRIDFTELRVNNRTVRPGDDTGILCEALLYTPEIRLGHRHTTVSVEYSVSNYIRLLREPVEYRLEGFDPHWISAPEGNRLSYTNLSPGVYTLRVRSLDGQAERALHLVVRPPFYATWQAYLLYAVVILSLGWYLLRSYVSQVKLKTSLQYATKEKDRIEELNQNKLRFFTNVSHELRTPVTLILSQIEGMNDSREVPRSLQPRLTAVTKNVRKMQQLLNEILDFRKQEQGFLIPKVQHLDVSAFLREICTSFREYAEARHTELRLEGDEQQIELWFDPALMEKVFYNLLSNAFKFTPEGGRVTVSLHRSATTVEVRVTDTGIGILPDKLPYIFDRFYQVDHNRHHRGTGIGLALAKGIVEAHCGEISVHSREGKGSEFCVSLLQGASHFDTVSYTTGAESYQLNYDTPPDGETELQEATDSTSEGDYTPTRQPKILIVEDNAELLQTLRTLFVPIYTVYLAADGEEGLQKAQEEQPDIILSDVMMPGISGVELCRRIKTQLSTAHIPVVLLTARAAIEHTLEGFKTGADDYIIKPFHNKLLVARCNNLVNNRRALQAMFRRNADMQTDMLAVNVLDQQLLDKAIRIVEENLTHPQFDVVRFAEHLNMGRTTLFSKLKGITGQTPNEFIMSIRLRKAVHLLRNHPELNVTDIAFQTGFSDTAYFVKCFKSNYGKTPLQYRKGDRIKEK